MLYSDDDGRNNTPCSEQESRDEIRNKWINERVQKLMYDPYWLYGFDMSVWDDENYRNLIHLPVLLVQHLSCLAPDWRKAIKESKGVDRLIEIADTLYELIQA